MHTFVHMSHACIIGCTFLSLIYMRSLDVTDAYRTYVHLLNIYGVGKRRMGYADDACAKRPALRRGARSLNSICSSKDVLVTVFEEISRYCYKLSCHMRVVEINKQRGLATTRRRLNTYRSHGW